MITLTQSAADQIAKLIAEDDNSDNVIGIRLAVRGGGCAGMMYEMELIEKSAETDKQFEQLGVTVFMDPKSYLFLNGVKMDYKKGLMGEGFVFENPNAQGNCGCGTSFTPGD